MYTTVIIEDDPMITRLNRRYIEQDSRFAVVQTFSAAHPALFWLRRNPRPSSAPARVRCSSIREFTLEPQRSQKSRKVSNLPSF